MKRFIISLIIITFCINLFGCVEKQDMNQEDKSKMYTQSHEEYDNTTPIESLEMSKLNLSGIGRQLTYPERIAGTTSFVIDINMAKEELKNLCIRKNDGRYYGVTKIKNSEGKIMNLFILFNENMQFIDGMLLYKLVDKSSFSNILENVSTLEDVKKVDPSIFVYEGETVESFHRCTDGTVTVIQYYKAGNKYLVDYVEYIDDPTGFVKLLLPKDLEAIK